MDDERTNNHQFPGVGRVRPGGGLESEISAERSRRDAQDAARRREAEEEQRERDEIRRLALEAVEHLTDLDSETFVTVRPVRWALFAETVPGADDTTYRMETKQRCWRLADISSRITDNGPLVDTPVLLLEDGTIGMLRPVALRHRYRGLYFSTTTLTPVKKGTIGFDSIGGTNFVTAVRQRLARVVVEYERRSGE